MTASHLFTGVAVKSRVAGGELIGGGKVAFTQDAGGLHLILPANKPAYAFRITLAAR